uniref:Uncharacterized protein n=1 Tax=Chrysemys picta bellii TaxID=8478 RepID=A0A8C3H4P6_CHRPI
MLNPFNINPLLQRKDGALLSPEEEWGLSLKDGAAKLNSNSHDIPVSFGNILTQKHDSNTLPGHKMTTCPHINLFPRLFPPLDQIFLLGHA